MNKLNFLLLGGVTMFFSACASTSDLKTDVLMTANLLRTPAEVNLLMENSPKEAVQLLDVRTPEEFEAGCLADAKNVDVKSDSFDQKIAELDKRAEYLLYCRSGKRSADAANRMRQAGFAKVMELQGGFVAWQEAGYKITEDCK